MLAEWNITTTHIPTHLFSFIKNLFCYVWNQNWHKTHFIMMADHDIWLLTECQKRPLYYSIDEHLILLVIIQHSWACPVMPCDEVTPLYCTPLGIFHQHLQCFKTLVFPQIIIVKNKLSWKQSITARWTTVESKLLFAQDLFLVVQESHFAVHELFCFCNFP